MVKGAVKLLAGAVLGSALTLGTMHYLGPEDKSGGAVAVEECPPCTPCPVIPLPTPVPLDSRIIVSLSGYKVPVSANAYCAYRHMRHVRFANDDLSRWAVYDDAAVKRLAGSVTEGLHAPEEKAEALLRVIQSYPYERSVEDGFDPVKYPLETLVERGGDCEDLAILGAALMKAAGLDVALLDFPMDWRADGGHVALGIAGGFEGAYWTAGGKRYHYAEVADANREMWRIGELPPELARAQPQVYVVK